MRSSLNQSVDVGRMGPITDVLNHEGSGILLPNLPNASSMNSPKLRINRNGNQSPDRSISPRDQLNGSPLKLDVTLDSSMMQRGGVKHNRNMSQKIRINALREVNDLSKSVAIPRTYKVSVQDMINSAKKVNDEFGIDNYENPHIRFNPYT